MYLRFLIICCCFLPYSVLSKTDKTLYIYHDADYSLNKHSAQAMRMGLLTAFNEVNNTLQGITFELIEKNHRGNIKRSKQNMIDFIHDEKALFILGGMHSPPYIQNRKFINENTIPLLVSWAAGGPVTRYPSDKNSAFRLSIDDTKAGIKMSQFALENKCNNPHLLLEDTAWGRTNQKTMSAFLKEKTPFDVSIFGWNIKKNAARIILRNIIAQNHDCILLVANFNETKLFVDATMSLPKDQRIPFISHWGATGGNIDEIFTKDVKQSVEFHVIQSCYSLTSPQQTMFQQQVIQSAKRLFPHEFSSIKRVKAPAGFIHSYDLGRIIIAAIQQTTFTGNITTDRLLFINALENIQAPIQGLVKRYEQPFTVWSSEIDDAHEALDIEDFCMASFGPENEITLTQ